MVTACRSKTALDELVQKCHGKKRCMIQAEEYVFGNPCPKGVNKYLTVIYTCGKCRIQVKQSHRVLYIKGVCICLKASWFCHSEIEKFKFLMNLLLCSFSSLIL